MRAALLACLSLFAAAAPAQEASDIDRGILDERQVAGLEQAAGFIVDRTVTNFGAEFVRAFSQAWREQPGAAELEVTIVEKPSARFGSIVWIEHNSRPVARAFLYAGRSAAIRPIAEAAAEYVAKKLGDEALAGLIFQDPDLAKEGF
jgi:curli production assembly/transport component CsgE